MTVKCGMRERIIKEDNENDLIVLELEDTKITIKQTGTHSIQIHGSVFGQSLKIVPSASNVIEIEFE